MIVVVNGCSSNCHSYNQNYEHLLEIAIVVYINGLIIAHLKCNTVLECQWSRPFGTRENGGKLSQCFEHIGESYIVISIFFFYSVFKLVDLINDFV